MRMLSKNLYDDLLKKIENPRLQIKSRVLKNGSSKVIFLYVDQLTDKLSLSNDVIKPISTFISENGRRATAEHVYCSVIYNGDCIFDDKKDKIMDYVLSGMTAVLFTDDTHYIAVNVKKVSQRSIDTPELTYTLRGPRDCFNESLDTNLSLIRYRIKDPNLNINVIEVGKRTKTKVAILHIGDIANDSLVSDVTNRIKQIKVDGIVDSGQMQNMIQNKSTNLFPQMRIVERSDEAARLLLDGKVFVLVDGSVLGLIAPATFQEFFISCDDVYDNRFAAILMKYVRIYSTIFSFSITALYVAILCFHIDTLPVDFIVSIRDAREGVPFIVLVGALILELIMELIRESLLRIPKQIGAGVAIVGGIVIGQAAISARAFDALLLIVVSLSLLSSFTAPDFTIANPLRIIKFFMIIVSGAFGLIGFTLGISIVLINLVSINSFGTPYVAPFAPFNWYDIKATFFYNKDISPLRPNFQKTKDNVRSPIAK